MASTAWMAVPVVPLGGRCEVGRTKGAVVSRGPRNVGVPASGLKKRGVGRAAVGQVRSMDPRVAEMPENRPRPRQYRSPCYVTKDNIDTDQIIPAEFLTWVPSVPDEYELLGSKAMAGLPEGLYPEPYVPNNGGMSSPYRIMIGGDNFGCGSSREHAPIAMGAAGCRVIVAESYARIFFRNCVATGEVYPYEIAERICDVFKVGDDCEVDLTRDVLINHTQGGKEFKLKPLGDAGPVIDAGGLFPFARAEGMISK